MTVNAMKVIITNYMPANNLTDEEYGDLWDLVSPQYGNSSVNGLPRCESDDEFKCTGFQHRFFINMSDAQSDNYANVSTMNKKEELKFPDG